MIDNALDLKETKQSRVECVAEETAKLLSWCETGIKMICDQIKGSTGKTSRREEIAWWSQISKSANYVKEEIVKFNDNIQKLNEHFPYLQVERQLIRKKEKTLRKG